MKIYNTLTRHLEEFKPITDKKVLFYHCGPTVYWTQHIGNLRAMVWADLIRRSLTYLGFDVKFVRNYTDVGHLVSDGDEGIDKMEKGARREGLTPKEIADKYIAIFEKDTKALNIIEPDYKPRASEYIKPMQAMIQTLIDRGFAYITDLAVVYDVAKFPNYNELNRQNLEFNKPMAGKGKIEDPQKKHFADFNLWVFKKGAHAQALQTWPSSWGEGFPGWHIECSVMAKELLGPTLDIHMGGIEHVPVHHTNEIAQSEAANSTKFVNYWLHNEHLSVEDTKMAKSAGTGLTLQEVKDSGHDPLALRYFFLSAHYRSKQNFTWEGLNGAEESLKNLRQIVASLKSEKKQPAGPTSEVFEKKFSGFLANDFQIPQALAMTWEMVKSDLSPKDKLNLIAEFDRVFGLRLSDVVEEKIPEDVVKLAKERKLARVNRDFKKSDELRKRINSLGYTIEDLAGNRFEIRKS